MLCCAPTLKCGPYEVLKVIHDALKQLKARTLKENLVMKACLRNGLLAWRPNMEKKVLEKVEPETQPWCKDLPAVGDSHRLKPQWVKHRFAWLDSDGVPLEPNWAECSSAKTLEEQADLDAVQDFTQVKATGDAHDDLKGPDNDVAGVKYECLQICLPEFGELDDSLKTDVMRACHLQLNPKQRLLDQEISPLLTDQVVKGPEKSKKKLEEKVLKGKVRAAMLAKWRRGAEKAMTDDGRSRMELLDELVPVAKRVKADDHAQKAVAEFMKLQQAYEAQYVL